jgi:transcriptional regulator with XRE-family HTH domain
MQRLGASFRAVRIKRGWRQVDVALRARVHRSVVSRIERGHLEQISVGTLLSIARVLEIQVTWSARWRGGDLDRLLAGRHARLHEAVADWFASTFPDSGAGGLLLDLWRARDHRYPRVASGASGTARDRVEDRHRRRESTHRVDGSAAPARVADRAGSWMGAADGIDLGSGRWRTDQPGTAGGPSSGASERIPDRRPVDRRLAPPS